MQPDQAQPSLELACPVLSQPAVAQGPCWAALRQERAVVHCQELRLAAAEAQLAHRCWVHRPGSPPGSWSAACL